MSQPTNNQADTHPPSDRKAAWYRQPIVWLGAFMFIASLAGCVWIIVVASQYNDAPVQGIRTGVLGVPASSHTTSSPPQP
ncbi:MAG: hypothetical protein ACTS5I_17210 [Rhodanobacter sp.]